MAEKFTEASGGSKIDPDSFYPTPVAAKLVFRSTATLETLRTRGGGPIYTKRGRYVLYRGADLIAWLTHATFASTSDDDRVTPREGRFVKGASA